MQLLSNFLGSFLLFVYWSDTLVPGCPHKINITAKGDIKRVNVYGEGLNGGISGSELKVFVDTTEAGPGKCGGNHLFVPFPNL
ncbi:unnamed protein product [Lymnaea stagnalis]|uniref:Uncharacterized protein n=1 Tax=Lymnaea stagnalis TaxID=6523 RepID=A0AAV2IQ13_LYMST